MKRSEFKSLVKECLVEILSEQFISTTVKQAINESIQAIATVAPNKQLIESKQHIIKQVTNTAEVQAMKQKLREIMAPDTISRTTVHVEPIATTVQALIEETDEERMKKFQETLARVKMGASNKQKIVQPAREQVTESSNALSSIFKDTAETTLQQQMAIQPGELAPNDPGIDISSFINPHWKTIAGIKS